MGRRRRTRSWCGRRRASEFITAHTVLGLAGGERIADALDPDCIASDPLRRQRAMPLRIDARNQALSRIPMCEGLS
jgi:hypothetical protein